MAWASTTRAAGASAQGARADPTAATHPRLRTKDSCTRQRCGDPGGLADPDRACPLEPQTNWHPPADQVLATHTASRTRHGKAVGPRGPVLHTSGSAQRQREAGSPRCGHRARRRRRNQTPSGSACSGTVQRAQQLERSRSSRHRRGNCHESASHPSLSHFAHAVQRIAHQLRGPAPPVVRPTATKLRRQTATRHDWIGAGPRQLHALVGQRAHLQPIDARNRPRQIFSLA